MATPFTLPSVDMSYTTSLLAQGSPKGMYTFFLLACAKNYFECMRSGHDEFNIENATIALIAFCPNREKRKELWNIYTTNKTDTTNTSYASVQCVGELVSYLSDLLEFEEQSNAGVF